MFGQPHRHYEQVDSTNRVALDWLEAPHGAVVTAESQTAGRGRLGRSWSSPAGKGLYLSVVLRPENATSSAFLSLVAALSVAQAVTRLTRVSALVKWPNDVLVSGHKIGGILCEARDERIVVGLGLNLNHQTEELPSRPLFPASSLLLLTGQEQAISAVQQAILEQLHTNLARDWQSLRDEYRARLYGWNELVRIGEVIGLLVDVGSEGELLIRTADGEKPIFAGDIEFL